jgi:MFS family permease
LIEDRARAETEPRVGKRAGLWAPFGYRDFRLLWSGLLISNVGTWMQFTTLGYVVVHLAANARLASLYAGLLGMSVAIPVLLLSPLAGAVADRVPRRHILVVTNSILAGLALALALLSTFDRLSLPLILALSSLRAATAAFDSPARQSWVSLIVPRESLGSAIGLNSIAFNAPSVIGPPFAGLLIIWTGVGAAFYVNAVATLAVIVAVFAMKAVPASTATREPVLRSIVAGVKFLAADPVLHSVILVLLATSLFVRPYAQMLPAYAAHVVHVDAHGLGLLLASSGGGAIVGSFVTALVGSRKRAWVWFASAVTMSLCAIALGATTSFQIAVLILIVMGMSVLSFAGSSNVLLQTLAPEEMRGRALSVFSMVILGLVPTGSLLLGTLGSLFGLPAATLGGGLVALAIVLFTFARNRAIRSV